MKIFFNRVEKFHAWGGGSVFVTTMVNYLRRLGNDVVFHLEADIDVIFMIDPRPGDIGYSASHIQQYKLKHPNVKIIHRINECDKRKDTNFIDKLILESNLIADKTVFISEWLAKYFIDKGFSGDYDIVYNGCDLNNFNPKSESSKNKKLKVVTHHWSDNWLKGFDIYTAIDKYLSASDQFEFTYVGRYNKSYTPKCTNLIDPLYGKALGDELRKHDVYVTASRFEPCGMHHIEGAASGLPVLFHKDGGGINELCENHGMSFNDFDDFLKKLHDVKRDINKYKKLIKYETLDIEKCCAAFNQVINDSFKN
tara:strand:+ start:349 stop:1278 length:930 start_codon:yes stop_codon:yes gene_type:complete